MPRTQRSVPPYSLISTPSACDAGLARFCVSEAAVPHAIFAPLHYERGYAYPLIVWLHGQGGNERQLQRIMPLVSMRNYVAVAPRGNRLPEPPDTEAYGWLQTEEHIQQAQQGVFDSLELASRTVQRVPAAGFLGRLRSRRHDGPANRPEPPGSLCRGRLLGREISQRPHALRQSPGGAADWRSFSAPAASARPIRPPRSARICGCFTRPASR